MTSSNGGFGGPTPKLGGFQPTPKLQTYGPSTIQQDLVGQLMDAINKHDIAGTINTDTSARPVAIWEGPVYRVVLSENWELEIEKNVCKDSMQAITWIREASSVQRERILSLCCIALLPEKIAESVVDE